VIKSKDNQQPISDKIIEISNDNMNGNLPNDNLINQLGQILDIDFITFSAFIIIILVMSIILFKY